MVDKTKNGLPILGELVWWRMDGVKVDRDVCVTEAKNAGMDLKAPHVSDFWALQKALEGMNRKKGRDLIVRGKKNNYHVASVSVDTKGIAAHSEVKLTIEKSDPLTVKYEGDASLTAEIKQGQLDWTNRYDAVTFGQMVKAYITGTLQGLTARESGGVYFVSKAKMPELDKMEKWLMALTNRGELTINMTRTQLVDEVRTKGEIGRIFEAEIKEASTELETYVKEAMEVDTGKAHQKSVNARLRRIEALKGKLEEYKGIAEGQYASLKGQIDDLEGKVMLLKMEDDGSEAKA